MLKLPQMNKQDVDTFLDIERKSQLKIRFSN